MSDTTTPLSVEQVAARATRIFPLMGRLMEARMRVDGYVLSPVHFHVLTMVNGRRFTLNEIADYQQVTPASLSRTITVMEERGWVTRTRSNEDRRVVYVEITSVGHDVLRQIEDISREFLEAAFADLSQADLNALMRGLDILIGSFAASMSHLPSDEVT